MPQVRVTEGVIEGEVLVNEFGGSYYSFRGIPYAEPPLGDLRFKPPQSPKPWDGVRCAKYFGPCSYHADLHSKSLTGSEDCLYLNVYSANINPDKPLAVMVWIHGGGFYAGSGNDDMYGPEFLVRHNIVLVTFNYRLGPFGFLCLDTEDIPGNAGMKDQVAALRWVKNNIRSFGGDPENITIFGESAGGASVSFHLISPMSKGLFKRAITQSGVANCPWAVKFEPREHALALARRLGFNSNNESDINIFFKNLPMESFLQDNIFISLAESQKLFDLPYAVVDEKQFGNNERFFFGDVYKNMRSVATEGIDIINGYTEHEGILFLVMLTIAVGDAGNTEKAFEHLNNYMELFVPSGMGKELSLRKQFEVGRRVKTHFLNNENVSVKYIDQIIKMLSMQSFIYPAIVFQNIFATKHNNTYLYKLICKSKRNAQTKTFGNTSIFSKMDVVAHADDLAYLFPAKTLKIELEKDSEDFKYIDRMTSLWTNFAKFGNPTPDEDLGIKWLPYSLENQDYLEIGNELSCQNSPDKDDVQFYEDLHNQYLSHVV